MILSWTKPTFEPVHKVEGNIFCILNLHFLRTTQLFLHRSSTEKVLTADNGACIMREEKQIVGSFSSLFGLWPPRPATSGLKTGAAPLTCCLLCIETFKFTGFQFLSPKFKKRWRRRGEGWWRCERGVLNPDPEGRMRMDWGAFLNDRKKTPPLSLISQVRSDPFQAPQRSRWWFKCICFWH